LANSALAFVWKGDALWTKTAPNTCSKEDVKWTSSVLPSRDPYALPNLTQFGELLCASLTFTAQLRSNQERLSIQKTIVKIPVPSFANDCPGKHTRFQNNNNDNGDDQSDNYCDSTRPARRNSASSDWANTIFLDNEEITTATAMVSVLDKIPRKKGGRKQTNERQQQ
jgi:hypothetical protein